MSWIVDAYRLFQVMQRPLGYRDISLRTSLTEQTAQKCICRLRKAGCIRFVSGNARTGRLYELVPGAPPPRDLRGLNPKSNNITQFNERRRASRPVSQFTAAKPKVA